MYGFIQVFAYAYDQGFEVDQAVGEVLQVLYYIASTHLLRYLILRFKWLNLRLARLIPKLLIVTLLLSVFNYAYLLGMESLTNRITPSDLLPLTIVVNSLLYWAVYFIWTIFYFAFHYVDRYNKSLKVESEAREAELNALKAQLNPHFIFNALNGIRALVDEDPNKSKESITQLSHLLRNSLMSDRKKLISFTDELRTVKDYLALESIRYEERLIINFDIDRRSNEFLIPPLMLQTLVENGIKHGISNLKNGGTIHIATTVRKKLLTLEIRNTGQLSNERKKRTGLGLENTKKRLELLFQGEAIFSIKNEDSKTVLTKILLPKYESNNY